MDGSFTSCANKFVNASVAPPSIAGTTVKCKVPVLLQNGLQQWHLEASAGRVLIRALAIASLFVRFLCNFTCAVSEALIR